MRQFQVEGDNTLGVVFCARDRLGVGNRVAHRLDAALDAVLGISWTEYRLLGALADATCGQTSRVDLAQTVGVTPSGVTRTLRPLEKRGLVATQRSDRDARLAHGILMPAGQGLVNDATKVVDDVMMTPIDARLGSPSSKPCWRTCSTF